MDIIRLRKKMQTLIGGVIIFLVVVAGILYSPVPSLADEFDWSDYEWEYRLMVQRERTLGINLELIDGRYVVSYVEPLSHAYFVGVQEGDHLISIEDRKLANLGIGKVRERLTIPIGNVVKLTLERENNHYEAFVLSVESEDSGFAWEVVNDVVLLKIRYFDDQTMKRFQDSISKIRELNEGNQVQGVILDLRDNRSNQYGNVGQLLIKVQSLTEKHSLTVLVNEHTSNAAEFLAMVLQNSAKATVIGTNTYTNSVKPDKFIKHDVIQKVVAIERFSPAEQVELFMVVDDSYVNLQGHMGMIDDKPIYDKQRKLVYVPLSVILESMDIRYEGEESIEHIIYTVDGVKFVSLQDLFMYFGIEFEILSVNNHMPVEFKLYQYK